MVGLFDQEIPFRANRTVARYFCQVGMIPTPSRAAQGRMYSGYERD